MSVNELSVSRKPFSFTIQFVIYAEPLRVFDTLTLREVVSTWCDGGGFIETVKDGQMEWFGGWVKGQVMEADRHSGILFFTWKPQEWDNKTPDSWVRLSLKPHPAGSEVTLEHGGFPNKEESDKHQNGWTDYVFEPLNDLFTGVSPLE
ncbi:MAG: SRPBCC domain-containing protein [Bacteroidota bacterium]|jgi:uncharacterized protein YndB with AHSA1/START domain